MGERAANVIARRAADAERQSKGAEVSIESIYEQRAHDLPRNKLHLAKGMLAQKSFVVFANSRFGNVVRTWFKLDPDEHMKLCEQPFARKCVELGYPGDIRALYR